MAEFGDVGRPGGVHSKFGQQLVIVEFVGGAAGTGFAPARSP